MRILPGGADAAHQAVERLLDGVCDETVEPPSHAFVQCDEDQWQRHAACLPVVTRRASVLIASSDEELLDAVRLEIGGAARLPVSTHGLTLACEAAARASLDDAACLATRALLEIVLAKGSDPLLVGWRPSAFWTNQVGSPRLIRALLGVARRLECIPAIVPGPFLVVTGCSFAEVEDAAVIGEDACGRPTPVAPAVIEVGELPNGPDRVRVDVLIEAAAAAGRAEVAVAMEGVRVLELPGGSSLGRWSLSGPVGTVADGWSAWPDPKVPDGSRWFLSEGREDRVIGEWNWSGDLSSYPDPVLRVPGWIGSTLRSGSPAALLVEGLAGGDGRAGRPLWVPGVDADGVRFLLSLPGPIWVDGPGVPTD